MAAYVTLAMEARHLPRVAGDIMTIQRRSRGFQTFPYDPEASMDSLSGLDQASVDMTSSNVEYIPPNIASAQPNLQGNVLSVETGVAPKLGGLEEGGAAFTRTFPRLPSFFSSLAKASASKSPAVAILRGIDLFARYFVHPTIPVRTLMKPAIAPRGVANSPHEIRLNNGWPARVLGTSPRTQAYPSTANVIHSDRGVTLLNSVELEVCCRGGFVVVRSAEEGFDRGHVETKGLATPRRHPPASTSKQHWMEPHLSLLDRSPYSFDPNDVRIPMPISHIMSAAALRDPMNLAPTEALKQAATDTAKAYARYTRAFALWPGSASQYSDALTALVQRYEPQMSCEELIVDSRWLGVGPFGMGLYWDTPAEFDEIIEEDNTEGPPARGARRGSSTKNWRAGRRLSMIPTTENDRFSLSQVAEAGSGHHEGKKKPSPLAIVGRVLRVVNSISTKARSVAENEYGIMDPLTEDITEEVESGSSSDSEESEFDDDDEEVDEEEVARAQAEAFVRRTQRWRVAGLIASGRWGESVLVAHSKTRQPHGAVELRYAVRCQA